MMLLQTSQHATSGSIQAQPDNCILSFEQVFIQWERQKTCSSMLCVSEQNLADRIDINLQYATFEYRNVVHIIILYFLTKFLIFFIN